tara:strand:- start:76 stop:1683 length:1608 start_codon:yes stop_codon:yes gene_type:complete
MNKFLFLLSCLTLNAYTTSFDTKNSLIDFYGKSQTKINIVIKDNIDIKEKVTTAGSLALKDNVATKNAFIIQKLIDSDFHISGKANLSEWANFRSENSVSGWSSIGGQTTHVLDSKYNPCGSSSGSAVAVASGIVDVAIGTETNGSISCPSSINGIIGFKPTVGLVSRSGIIPISSSQDTAGPMGKTLEIVAKTLEVISGFDQDDKATYLIPDDFDFNFLEVTNNKRLDGIRFGLLDADNQTPQVIELHKEIKSIVKNLGGEVIDINDNRIYPNEAEYFILLYEFRVGLQKYLETSSSSMRNLEDVIKFNEENKNTVMSYFGQDIFFQSLESDSYIRYIWSKYKVKNSYKATLRILEEYGLDAFIGLTRGPAWKTNYDGGDWPAMQETLRFSSGGYAAHNGMPHITIPFFNVDNFPVGISIIGKRWDDKQILKFASAIDSRFIDQSVIIDVRSLDEVKTGMIQDAIHIEWTEIDKEITNIDISKDQLIYLYCRSGNRSGKAAEILKNEGFVNVINAGGIKDAAEKLDKKIVKYSE